MLDRSPITALLGPTNTGKTHRAIERMLSYDSGMIGLPLRLLAREVYDRVSAEVGEGRVALVTGEERKIPVRPSYWICTVEAMPLDREVDFLAVDEIQLAANEQRGHVFTDRLLHARGRIETWFLGAATMRNAVQALAPTATITSHPRLSKLTFTGAATLSKLPARGAVIAFSTSQVYEVAERLRELHGGAAVVLGALSPRTRNAQVAMFQAGEVDHLVATDAIGMGLNLQVSHVAFAGLRKFDGRDVRSLDPPELAQIAGRAGRHLSDGSFGTVAPVHLDRDVARSIEEHVFTPITRLRFRASHVDMSSLDALMSSLRTMPRSPWLVLAPDAPDLIALDRLASDPAIRARARGDEAVGLLWDVCRIPDFRGELLDGHTELLRDLFLRLTGPEPRLSDDWISSQVEAIDDVTGDVDTLVRRISAIRTWTYVTHHARWVEHPEGWQDETHAIEDRLSDALHDRLVHRFVERSRGQRRTGKRAARSARKNSAFEAPRAGTNAAVAREPSDLLDVVLPAAGHPFAALAKLRGTVSALGVSPVVPLAEPNSDPWYDELIDAGHESFALDRSGKISHRGVVVAQLVAGSRMMHPEVRLLDVAQLGSGARAQIARRLIAFTQDALDEVFRAIRAPTFDALSSHARGLLYQLEQGLGTLMSDTARAQLGALTGDDRAALERAGIVLGALTVHTRSLLTPRALELRYLLLRLWLDGARMPATASTTAVSLGVDRHVDRAVYVRLGFPVLGPRAVRADIAERVAGLALADTQSESPLPRIDARRVSSLVGCSARDAGHVLDAIRELLASHTADTARDVTS